MSAISGIAAAVVACHAAWHVVPHRRPATPVRTEAIPKPPPAPAEQAGEDEDDAIAHPPGRRSARRGVLAEKLYVPRALVTDREHLYWIEETDNGCRIVRMPKRKGAPVVIADDVSRRASLALDRAWIYYLGGDGDDYIRRVSVSGDSVETVAEARDFGYQEALVVKDGKVCWPQRFDLGWQLMCAPVRGGSASAVREVPANNGFVMAGARTYSVNTDGVFVSEGTGSTRRIARGNSSQLRRDETHLYWSSGGSVWRAPLTGGEPRRIARNHDGRFALHEDHVYWVHGVRLFRAPKRGGDAELRARFRPPISHLDSPEELVVDKTGAYWMSKGTPDGECDCQCPRMWEPDSGVIVRLPL